MAARKEQVMQEVRQQLALAQAQELVNVSLARQPLWPAASMPFISSILRRGPWTLLQSELVADDSHESRADLHSFLCLLR